MAAVPAEVSTVSIHIRHCWRMNSCLLCLTVQTPSSFNPHSPLLANEFIDLGVLEFGILVSIHIRHCWRMNSLEGVAAIVRQVFQSTFAIAGE